jgi:hypothetical protein
LAAATAETPSLNISIPGLGAINPLVAGRSVDVICGDTGVRTWGDVSGEECLALVFDRSRPGILLYVSALTVAELTVAAVVLWLILYICFRKRTRQ